jgi:hypothetical protein
MLQQQYEALARDAENNPNSPVLREPGMKPQLDAVIHSLAAKGKQLLSLQEHLLRA